MCKCEVKLRVNIELQVRYLKLMDNNDHLKVKLEVETSHRLDRFEITTVRELRWEKYIYI